MESMPLGTCKLWSLSAGGLYILPVVFRAGSTVFKISWLLVSNNKTFVELQPWWKILHYR